MSIDQDRANAFIQRLQEKSVGRPVKPKTTQQKFREETPKRIRQANQYGNTPMEYRETGPLATHVIEQTGRPATRLQRLDVVAENEDRRQRYARLGRLHPWSQGGYTNLNIDRRHEDSNFPPRIDPAARIRAKLENDRSSGLDAIVAGRGITRREARDRVDAARKRKQNQ